jgi:hypothetical protein
MAFHHQALNPHTRSKRDLSASLTVRRPAAFLLACRKTGYAPPKRSRCSRFPLTSSSHDNGFTREALLSTVCRTLESLSGRRWHRPVERGGVLSGRQPAGDLYGIIGGGILYAVTLPWVAKNILRAHYATYFGSNLRASSDPRNLEIKAMKLGKQEAFFAASWGGLTAFNPALGFIHWPVGPGWYGNRPLALKSVNGLSPAHCISSSPPWELESTRAGQDV